MSIHTVFTPDAAPPELLRQITVGRAAELGALHDAFEAAATSKARPNVLVVGPRGSGKTHLLTVAEQEIRDNRVQSEALVVVRLPEDSYAVTSYRDLIAVTVRRLTGRDAARPPDDLALDQTLLDALDGRVLVWMVENLDRIFRVIGVEGQHKLRALLHNHGPAVLVASTPALSWGISHHDAPFYGAFRVLNLGELTVDQARELLLRVARMRGDDELTAFIQSDRGLRRLQAVADLAGGLPRLWHLLASCMTVELLDELVPLFIKLLDQLNPYYKARLDELPPAKAKLIAHLCGTRQRPLGAMTVGELAEAAGTTNQAASKQLGELERARFVRARKLEGGDQRATYYEVSEPLLRHCLELKESRGAPLLGLIVAALRDWHEAAALRRALQEAAAGSTRERYLAAALERPGGGPAATDELYASGWPGDLLAGARQWLAGDRAGSGVRSWLAAAVAETAVLAEWDGEEAAADAAKARVASKTMPGCQEVLYAALRFRDGQTGRNRPQVEVATGVAGRLMAAADCATECADLPPVERISVGLLAAGWLMATDRPAEALPFFDVLARESNGLADRRLALTAQAERAYCLGLTGRLDEAQLQGESVRAEREALLGADDPDTLVSRQNLACQAADAGDLAIARDRFAVLVEDRARVLGADNPETLSSRHNLACCIGEAGDPAAACELFAAVVQDRSRVLGVEHRATLASRHNLAYWTGEAGDPAAARDLLVEAAANLSRVLGADHPSALVSRKNLAHWTGDAGDRAAACKLFAAVVQDQSRILGADHPRTLSTRHDRACSAWNSGDPAGGLELLGTLVADTRRLFGPSDDRVVRWSIHHATLLGWTGEPLGALNELADVVPDQANADAFEAVVQESLRSMAVEMVNGFGNGDRTAEQLVQLHERWRPGALTWLAALGPPDVPFATWLLGQAVQLDIARQVTPALVEAGRLTPSRTDFLAAWSETTTDRAELEYQLAHRVLAAALALLNGNQAPLLALPPEERVLAKAAAGAD